MQLCKLLGWVSIYVSAAIVTVACIGTSEKTPSVVSQRSMILPAIKTASMCPNISGTYNNLGQPAKDSRPEKGSAYDPPRLTRLFDPNSVGHERVNRIVISTDSTESPILKLYLDSSSQVYAELLPKADELLCEAGYLVLIRRINLITEGVWSKSEQKISFKKADNGNLIVQRTETFGRLLLSPTDSYTYSYFFKALN